MDALYRLAFEFRKTKLWKKLCEDQLFALALTDGTIGYCSVIGASGEHHALSVYPGEDAFQSFCAIAAGRPNLDDIHDAERMLSRDCVMCTFENKDLLLPSEVNAIRAYCFTNGITLRGANAWPQLTRCRPLHIPWPVAAERDKRCLAEGLQAALEVAKRLESSSAAALGLSGGSPFEREIPLLVRKKGGYDWKTIALPPDREIEYPAAGLLYDLPLKRVSMQRQRTGDWACDVFLLPKPSTSEEPAKTPDGELVDAPFFPWVQVVYDLESGMIVDSTLCDEDDDYAEVFPNRLLELIEKLGKPRRLLVETDRTAVLYRTVGKRAGFAVVKVDECEDLDEALDDFIDHLSREDGDFDDLALEPPGEMVEQLLDVILNAPDFSTAPDELLLVMNGIAEAMRSELPPDRVRLLEKELRRRFH